MKKSEMKNWIKDAIDRNYDRDDVQELLKDSIEKGKITEEDYKNLLEMFDDEFAEVEKLKIGFFQRRRLKKGIKKVRELVVTSSKEIQKLTGNAKALNKEEQANLNKLKEEMIVAIVGDFKKGKEGLNSIFDLTDEDDKEITREVLEEYKIEDIEELLTQTLESLEKEL